MVRKLYICIPLILAMIAFMLLSSCAKQQISPEQVEGSAYEAEAERQAAEAARQREAERQSAIREESLGDASREGSLTDSQAAAAASFENEDVYFEFDSASLTAEAQEILRNKALWLKQNPRTGVLIEGHCDERGTNEYNLALGESRAKSAQQYLISLGIDESRLATVSYGEERPLDLGNTEAAWAKNRRAHFVTEK
jgi:peptidoglycan-associated lipoprotein